jgi:L-histidine N-alpha-methyltransferase
MYTPHFAASNPPDTERSSFAEDVGYYLSLTPRQLPSRYLYDEMGSALFEAICRLPWYRITRTERALIERHAGAIFSRAGQLSALVELGPGGGEKLVMLVSAHDRVGLTVHLVDVSPAALDTARRALAIHPELTVEPYQATYEAGLVEFARRPREAGGTMALCLGSNIGNFDPPDAEAFLQAIRAALSPGDWLLLGADLVKPEEELLLAYDDPLGVTAAFNRNLLVRVNRELGADFDLDGFAHRAVWNADLSRVEMHLVSQRPQRVRVPAAGLDLAFDSGEIIWTESSYKYTAHGIAAMLDRAGFGVADQWVADGFALTLGEAR